MTRSNTSTLIGAMPVILLSLIISANVGAVESKQATDKAAPLTQSYTWYNGDREQQVWLNPHLVAEFNPSLQGKSTVKSIIPSASVLPAKHQHMAIRFWQMDNADETTIRNLKAKHPQGKYSAVMHDGPSSKGRMRALPGNIIVYLNPGWSEAEVHNWLASHNLEIAKKLAIGSNVYVIKTNPGLEALDTANILYRSGEVKAAFPDWWQEATTR